MGPYAIRYPLGAWFCLFRKTLAVIAHPLDYFQQLSGELDAGPESLGQILPCVIMGDQVAEVFHLPKPLRGRHHSPALGAIQNVQQRSRGLKFHEIERA